MWNVKVNLLIAAWQEKPYIYITYLPRNDDSNKEQLALKKITEEMER